MPLSFGKYSIKVQRVALPVHCVKVPDLKRKQEAKHVQGALLEKSVYARIIWTLSDDGNFSSRVECNHEYFGGELARGRTVIREV